LDNKIKSLADSPPIAAVKRLRNLLRAQSRNSMTYRCALRRGLRVFIVAASCVFLL
jgi:hypothetical protein